MVADVTAKCDDADFGNCDVRTTKRDAVALSLSLSHARYFCRSLGFSRHSESPAACVSNAQKTYYMNGGHVVVINCLDCSGGLMEAPSTSAMPSLPVVGSVRCV